MRIYKLSIIMIVILSFGFCQTFDPETGELIPDTTQTVHYDPETGLPIQSANEERSLLVKSVVQPITSTTSAEIMSRAKFDAKQNFKSMPWKLMGAPVAGLSVLVGGISAAILDGIADQGFAGFVGGTGLTALKVPEAISKISVGIPVHAIIIAEELYPNLHNRTIYWDAYQQEIEHLRKKSIYNGELLSVGSFFGFIFLLIILD